MKLSYTQAFLCSSWLLFLLACGTTPVPDKPDSSLIQLGNQTFYVDSIRNSNRETLDQFIQTVLDAPLPKDYQAPEYLLEISSIDAAYAELYRRYPGIALRQGESLRTAIAEDPAAFVEMIYENRVLRNQISHLPPQ